MKRFGGLLSKKPTKMVVIVLWLLFLVGGIIGTSQMKVDADVDDFIPSGSYLRDFWDTTREQFGETGTDISLYWVNDIEVGGSCWPRMSIRVSISTVLVTNLFGPQKRFKKPHVVA